MLDDLELPQVQELATFDRRELAEHKPPGMSGSLLQNLGRQPTSLLVGGVATGPEAQNFIERLDEKFRAGNPVPFVADIISDTAIEEMVIDDLKVRDLAGKPLRFAYVLTLREFIDPVEPEATGLLDAEILDGANSLLDDLVDGLDIGLDFSTGLERFIEPLTGLLGRLRDFNQGR
jgi:hypothetical protein